MPNTQPPIQSCLWDSPIGLLRLAGRGNGLCGLWFDDQTGIPRWAQGPAGQPPTQGVLADTIAQLTAYFQGQRHGFDLPLLLDDGTPFQQAVWRQLAHIPHGHTCSYSDIAQAIGRPQAVRAVGGAVGRNPIGIVLPCHRVVGRSGALTGYTGGLARKQALLRLEAR